MSEALFQNLSTVQGLLQPKPNTIASAAVVTPVSFISFISGTTDIATVTPPVEGQHLLTFIFTDSSPGDILTTGNVLIGTTTVAQYSIVLLFYNPNQAKYYPAKLT
jgi:hypothetical protein